MAAERDNGARRERGESGRSDGARSDPGRSDPGRSDWPRRPGEEPRTTPITTPMTRPRLPQAAPAAEARTGKGGAAPAVRKVQSRGGMARRLALAPVRWLGLALAVLVPLAGLGVGLAYLRLQHGAIPLSFMAEPVRAALAAELDGATVKVGDITLARSASGGIELRVVGLGIDSQMVGVIDASEAVLGVDLGALWAGRIVPYRLVLVAPRLVLDRAKGATYATRHGGTEAASPRQGAGTRGAEAATGGSDGLPASRLDLGRILAEAVGQLRRGGEAASHLRVIGLRDATVAWEASGRPMTWRVPALEMRLEHRQKRSLITGDGQIATGGQPFAVAFRLEQSEKARSLKLVATVDGARVDELAQGVPGLAALGALDAGFNGRGEVELSDDGDLVGGRFDVDLGNGTLRLGPGAAGVLGVRGGGLALSYAQGERRLLLEPSRIELDHGWMRLRGALAAIESRTREGGESWQLELEALEGALVGGAASVPLERLRVAARLHPESGTAALQTLSVKAGGAEIEAHGAIMGGSEGATSLEGRIGPIDLATLKALWPPQLLPRARELAERALVGGRIRGGSLRLSREGQGGSQGGAARMLLSLEAEDIAVAVKDGLPPLMVPRALLTQSGGALEVSMPDAYLNVAAGRRLAIKGGTLVLSGLEQGTPLAEVNGRVLCSLATLTDIASREPIGMIKAGQVPPGTDGKVDAQVRLVLPLDERAGAADNKIEVKGRISEARIPNVIGTHDVTGASFAVSASDRALEVKGDLLIAGSPAKVSGQWIWGEAHEKQSPLVVTARLDTADRRQLGMALDDLVQGEVPVEVQIWPGDGERGRVLVSAELTGAEVALEGLAWRKPAGRAARMSFEVVRQRGGKTTELQAFRVAGESIAIDGSVLIGVDGQAQAFRFPGFSLNVVSNLEVEGVRRPDKTWEVKARGKTFDGGELMRSLYAFDRSRPAPATGGLDLDARIETVLGLNDTAVRQLSLRLRRQGDQLTGLELSGTLDGGQPIEARLVRATGQGRVVHATTPDAGQALKTIGFYTNMLGGRGDLWVALDGRGEADRTGRLEVTRFRVLGDPIVSELMQGADDNRPAIATGTPRAQRRVVREETAFETLRASFASGNSQLAIESLVAAGPLIGLSLRGKLDFRTRGMSLGGTYIPLSGLNRALAGIPLVGELITGPKGDGIFGITFAVNGPMAQPNVVVNPLSIVAPGVLREIFQMAPDNARVTPEQEPRKVPGGGPKVRSSPPESQPRGTPPGTSAGPRVLDGWSSQQQRSPGD